MTVVAIDDRAVEVYGRWPWPRAIQAELIMAILDANPAVLGVDIVYSELDDAWSDSRLARVLDRRVPVVLAAAKSGGEELFPEEIFVAPNVRLGHINTPVDSDGVVRRLSLEVETRRGVLKALSWEVAALARASRRDDDEVAVLPPPLDSSGRLLRQLQALESPTGRSPWKHRRDDLCGRCPGRPDARPADGPSGLARGDSSRA